MAADVKQISSWLSQIENEIKKEEAEIQKIEKHVPREEVLIDQGLKYKENLQTAKR
jgi:hypothetical protein